MAETLLEARYVSRAKLTNLLTTLFGDAKNYDVTTENDMIQVTAPRQLTPKEIESITDN
ncbi:hypothetical protein FVEN_g12923 [Fusarium venenatum]|uniref:Uncharacterized protein n=1 Tax=Fusarium venenatum TaxID=56646 RepID=A0A2L2T730_9HYPO|nr:uncharacterized protein FVRRES_04363 [Fusarium venenatum]KAG8353979.1 hypothetical protein FVEN_g12923 [Fusarium venenatum]CEI59927.1 unnamed protein product [Fusarium venenatum]